MKCQDCENWKVYFRQSKELIEKQQQTIDDLIEMLGKDLKRHKNK